jgi:hypothetical protein
LFFGIGREKVMSPEDFFHTGSGRMDVIGHYNGQWKQNGR